MRRGLPFIFSPNSILLITSPALLADGSSFFSHLNPVAAVGARTSLL